jgi:DNA-binding winged helix-turn-helix (wHTH) protein
MQHRDRVVSKAEFLEYLWSQQYRSETTLSQRLMLMCKAIDDNGLQQRVITTVPGHGYRFVATVEEQTEISLATARRCSRGLRPCRPRRRDGRTSWRP